MSRAIRQVAEDHSTTGTLGGIDTATLADFVAIVGAFYADLKDELARRSDRAPEVPR
jgi:hypothetical protein